KTEMEEYLTRAVPEADAMEPPSPVKASAPSGIQPRLRDPDAARKASGYICALGGADNIVRVDACAETRLTVVVRDDGKVGESALRAGGIAAVVRRGGGG